MKDWFDKTYENLLQESIKNPPKHVAIIQDGNRRYAQKYGIEREKGHREGAKTTESVLEWCKNIGVEELTLYVFSTENFSRSKEEQKELFELIELKLNEIIEAEMKEYERVRVKIIGQIERLPKSVGDSARKLENQTMDNKDFKLNIALGYGGRDEMLDAARKMACCVKEGKIRIEDIDNEMIESRFYKHKIRDVDLIIRTGGDERTSNFLPWHANGNEAAVFFCTPYWPGFTKIDFLRGIRTYEYREKTWQMTRTDRAMAIIQTMIKVEIGEARNVTKRLKRYIPESILEEMIDEIEKEEKIV
tara:strand:- start:198 stop:1109 length:912 start_codon:yes stop_codon:yes gene_type:complete